MKNPKSDTMDINTSGFEKKWYKCKTQSSQKKR